MLEIGGVREDLLVDEGADRRQDLLLDVGQPVGLRESAMLCFLLVRQRRRQAGPRFGLDVLPASIPRVPAE